MTATDYSFGERYFKVIFVGEVQYVAKPVPPFARASILSSTVVQGYPALCLATVKPQYIGMKNRSVSVRYNRDSDMIGYY